MTENALQNLNEISVAWYKPKSVHEVISFMKAFIFWDTRLRIYFGFCLLSIKADKSLWHSYGDTWDAALKSMQLPIAEEQANRLIRIYQFYISEQKIDVQELAEIPCYKLDDSCTKKLVKEEGWEEARKKIETLRDDHLRDYVREKTGEELVSDRQMQRLIAGVRTLFQPGKEKFLTLFLQESKLRHFGTAYSCEKCGGLYHLAWHHIKTRGAGGGDEKENLMCLCRKCHNLKHAGLI